MDSPTPTPEASIPDPRFAVPESLADMTIGEFVIAELKNSTVRPTALNIKPHRKSGPYRYVSEMPIPYFLEHVRGWHLLLETTCGSPVQIAISKALERFNVAWG